MNWLAQRLSMKHLMMISIAMILIGILWVPAVLMSSLDNIWIVPGIFLVIAGIVKVIVVLVWIRLARLGTDEHRPIKAS